MHMTKKQKIMAIVWIALVVIAFVILYRQFSERSAGVEFVPPRVMSPVPPSAKNASPTRTTNVKQATPETPDSVVDDVLLNDADFSALDGEEIGETQAAEESVQTIDDITNTYDEQSL